jgi:hypothetical protein
MIIIKTIEIELKEDSCVMLLYFGVAEEYAV